MFENSCKNDSKAKLKYNDTKMKKFITIIVTSLFLLIPILFLYIIIGNRQDYKQEAVNKIKLSWAGVQVVQAPQVYYPVNYEDSHQLELNNFDANIKINTEIRKKGIFKIPVYVADVNLKGDIKNNFNLTGKKVRIQLPITDPRGLETVPIIKINGEQPQITKNMYYLTEFKSSSMIIPFEVNYKIRGLKEIAVALEGINNKVLMSGDWEDPSFEGNFLPKTREITSKGFIAEWSVPQIALSQDSKPLYDERIDEINNNSNVAKVSLFVATDNYKLTEKVLKYAFLFLLLTFLSYFVFEITSKEKFKIHPIQYCLLGGAILIFYLLLVSMSEFIPFWTSYVISAFMIISMIFTYTYFIVSKKSDLKFAQLIAALMTLLYSFLYILLQIQDFALLMGSIGLFVIIAIVMYITRNVEWYSDQEDNN